MEQLAQISQQNKILFLKFILELKHKICFLCSLALYICILNITFYKRKYNDKNAYGEREYPLWIIRSYSVYYFTLFKLL